ncbi:MAG: hypothetical protein KJ063_25245 [Anaerolineae bacterium]|nr:hypothetical protein [Anaerolineae bacterium]
MKHNIIKLSPLLVLIIVIIFYSAAKTVTRNIAQSQSSTTATLFMFALVRNDEWLLTEIVVPQQREEISKWLSSHRSFFCPPGLDFPVSFRNVLTHTRFISQEVYLFQNFNRSTSTTARFNAFYQCRIDINSDRGLNFEVWDIVLERMNNKWYVRSWRFGCESERLNGCG